MVSGRSVNRHHQCQIQTILNSFLLHLLLLISWQTLGGRVYSKLLGIGSTYGRVTVWLNIFLSLVIDMLVWSFSKLLNVAWDGCSLIADGNLFQRRIVLGKKE